MSGSKSTDGSTMLSFSDVLLIVAIGLATAGIIGGIIYVFITEDLKEYYDQPIFHRPVDRH
jgi:hypothetical protein